MARLDAKDRKLLYLLDFNCRKPYSQLAAQLRLSKRGVHYKLVRLQRDGIVLGYAPVINVCSLGYWYGRVFVKMQGLDSQLEKQVEVYMAREANIGWAIRYYGPFDYGFTIWAKSLTEFKQIANRFYLKFDRHIKRRVESVGTRVVFFKNRFLLSKEQRDLADSKSLTMNELDPRVKLDALDFKLLAQLGRNARTPIVKLARRTGETPKRVAYRLKRLAKQGVLLGSRPVIDHEKLGYAYHKLFINLANLSERQINALEKHVENDHRTVYVVKAIGTADFDVEIMAESNKDLYAFISEMQNKFPGVIKDYELMTLTKTIKISYLPQRTAEARPAGKRPRQRTPDDTPRKALIMLAR